MTETNWYGFGKHLDRYIHLLYKMADFTEYKDYTGSWAEGDVRLDEDTNELIVGDALSLKDMDFNDVRDVDTFAMHLEGLESLVKECEEARSKGLERHPDWRDEDYVGYDDYESVFVAGKLIERDSISEEAWDSITRILEEE